MPDFQPPQWSEFKVPGGGADLSYVGPVANAYSAAAEMATKPLNRMLEQVLASRLQEKSMLQQQQYASQQQSRAFQDQTMRDRLNDAAALERINTEYDRRAEMERIAQEEKARQAQILTSTLWGGGPAMASPAGGVAPGTGALKFEDVYGAGPQEGFAPPPPGLDPAQIGTVYNAQQLRAERNQNNAEQAATAAAKAAAAEAARASMDTAQRTILGDKALDDASKVRLLARLPNDQPGAWDEYQQIIKEQRDAEAEKAKAKVAKAREEESGFFAHPVPGVPEARLTLAVRDLPKQGVTAMSEMKPKDIDSLWQVATRQVANDLVGRSEVTQLDAQGLLDPSSPLAGKYARAVRLRMNEIASTFGWDREPGFESGNPNPGQAQVQPQAVPAAQAAAAPNAREAFLLDLATRERDPAAIKRHLAAFDAGKPMATKPAGEAPAPARATAETQEALQRQALADLKALTRPLTAREKAELERLQALFPERRYIQVAPEDSASLLNALGPRRP